MPKVNEEFALLLEAPHPVAARLAQNLLKGAGIPSFLHGHDRDFAELGFAAHLSAARPSVFVAKHDKRIARDVLIEAWGSLDPDLARGDEPQD